MSEEYGKERGSIIEILFHFLNNKNYGNLDFERASDFDLHN